MKRSGPLKRKTPLRSTPLPDNVVPIERARVLRSKALHPGGSTLKRTPLAQRSPARVAFMAEVRAPAVRSAIEAQQHCEVGRILRLFPSTAIYAERCFGAPLEGESRDGWGYHERRKRSSAGSLVNPHNLLWSCPRCNGAVEDHPFVVREATGSMLIVRPGDQEWDRLGKRADR